MRMTLQTTTSKHLGLTIHEHQLEVPWDWEASDSSTTATTATGTATAANFRLFARELVPSGGEAWPVLVYLQGGPGFPAPRPTEIGGLLGEALRHYRVLLLEQRGTGRSARIDANDPQAIPLHLLRQEHIVRDAEALREALGIERWSLYGQSFGGFCITSYLSIAPESVEHAFLTGGLPTLGGVDELYRSTFTKLRSRQLQFFREYEWAESRIRQVCHHLEHSDERLPTGERLSARRLRTVGIQLGRGNGFHALAYLFEDPFTMVRGERRLKTDFLHEVGAQVSFAQGPLYAAIHESIYGGVASQEATNWSAHRVREEIPGFEEHADPQGKDPFFLTGEHIFPWMFEEDPALQAFQQEAEALAARRWERSPYDAEVLSQRAPSIGAAVYLDDIFVPFEESMATAQTYRDARLMVTNLQQHDGIRTHGGEIFAQLRTLVNDH